MGRAELAKPCWDRDGAPRVARRWSAVVGLQDLDEAVATIRAALDAGIEWLDTAPFYGWGRAEELVGAAVRQRRDEVTILTKCGTIRRPYGTRRVAKGPVNLAGRLQIGRLSPWPRRRHQLDSSGPQPLAARRRPSEFGRRRS